MKSIKVFLAFFLLGLILFSCEDKFSVDLSEKGFVRLNKQSVSINAGEKYVVKSTIDTLGNANRSFIWTIQNPEIASIEAKEDRTAVITGLSEGSTIIQVESSDKSLKYFSDLTVGKDRVIKILAIGNSFSEDAIENYLYDLAVAAGYKVMIGNMYIGGQSLEGHWKNALENNASYQLRLITSDGELNRFNDKSIMDVISLENWDYISFQEVSLLSGIIDGFREYLPRLVEYAKKYATNPEVKYMLHQTWAYAEDSNHFGFPTYDRDQITMYNAIVEAVWQAKEIAGIDMIIPAGTAIQNGRTSYIGDKFTRDGYHLNLSIGRFTAASTWFETIFGDIMNNPFNPEILLNYDAQLAKTAAAYAISNPKQITDLVDFKEPGPNEFILELPLFIDFGPVESPEPFNNFRHPNDVKVGALTDIGGANSNFAIEIKENFTGTLSRGLQNVLGLPQSASEDMFFSDGIHIPQSSLTLSNLNRNQAYTLVFYGTINDDKTETEFNVRGENEKTGYLDNDNNLGKLVVIEDIQPAEDATITVEMKPGPNNNHFARFFGLNTMMILPAGTPVPIEQNNFVMQHPVYVDFGTLESLVPIYHFGGPTDAPRFDLTDETGKNTGFSMSITDRFTGDNHSGTLSTTIGLPQSVSQDAFWGNRDNPVAGFTLYNMNINEKYQFVFFGSRRDVGDNRETKYRINGINGGEAYVNAANNDSKVAIIQNIQPNQDGTVDIAISAGPNNTNGDGYYYVNTMLIFPEGNELPF